MAESDHNSKNKSIYNGPRSTTISSIQHANNAAKPVQLSDASGAQVALAPIGAAIQAIHVPTGDRSVNVVLGYKSASRYASNPHYLGTTVGRYAGRIRNGRFPLNGQVVRVASDSANGGHCLHGGPNGLHARAWDVDSGADATSATFRTRSEHGEEGFPGTLDVSVRYTLAAKTLVIEYFATSDADTALNLTNHAYFNLKGSGLVDGQQVTINADSYAPVDAEGIPTGEIRDVSGTEFDLREPLRLQVSGARRNTVYDDTFVLKNNSGPTLEVGGADIPLAASATSVDTGIRLNVFTSQPGLQFYTGQYLDDEFAPFSGMCFEAQGFPDAPNQPTFPSTLLRAGEEYRQVIVYQFETMIGRN